MDEMSKLGKTEIMRSEMTQTESQQISLRALSYVLELQGAE